MTKELRQLHNTLIDLVGMGKPDLHTNTRYRSRIAELGGVSAGQLAVAITADAPVEGHSQGEMEVLIGSVAA